jgi:Trk K+ transport system NAD-binding subunit
MALLCVRPAVTRFLDTSEDFKFEEILVPDNSPITGKTLKDSGIRQAAKAIVVAIQSSGGTSGPIRDRTQTISSGHAHHSRKRRATEKVERWWTGA